MQKRMINALLRTSVWNPWSHGNEGRPYLKKKKNQEQTFVFLPPRPICESCIYVFIVECPLFASSSSFTNFETIVWMSNMICNDDQVRPALHGQELGLGGLHRLLASQLTRCLRHGFTFTLLSLFIQNHLNSFQTKLR